MNKTQEQLEKLREVAEASLTKTDEIEGIVDMVIKNNPSQVKEYLGGKSQLLGYFVGQIMKETKGKANPQKVNEILKNKLI